MSPNGNQVAQYHHQVGDYVTTEDGQTGILYEPFRIQLANGEKVRSVFHLAPASPEAIAKFQAEAVKGMTPEAIIAREKVETEERKATLPKLENEDEEDE